MTVETFLLICLAAILCAGAIYLVRSRLKASHRKKLFDKALTRAQIAIIIENVSLYRKLPKKFQQELHGCIQIFLDSKEFVGCSEVQITEEIQLTVAANACLLLLTRNIRDFPGFKTILIYPDTYHVPQTSQKGDLEVRHVSGRAGESWYRGPIVLSWGGVIRGSKNEEDGFNVVLHEFAHKLDEQNAVMDGLPILREENSYSEWAEVLSEEYKKFQKDVIFLSGINYQGLTKDLFIESITHGGKKYDRLYYPDSIKKIISENFPRVQDVLSRNPKDFFGNILCDEKNIYRNGFNDALSYIFNKYFDFKFDILPNHNPTSSLHGQDKSIDVVNKGSLIFTKSLRGNLWEPELYHNGKVNTKIDENHVFNELADDKKYEILLLALAKQELDIFDPNVKEIFENYRLRVSKEISNFINK